MPGLLLSRIPTVCRRNAALIAVLLLLLTGSLWGWSTAPQPAQPQQPASPSQPQTMQQPGTPAQNAPGTGPAVQTPENSHQEEADDNQPEPETHITKRQAKELFRSVDEILGFVSGDTGLPIKENVKRNLITREQVEKYVDKRMKDDKDEKRLEQARLVLQKFGLLPKGYDLHAEFLKLMGEQVAAFYDPKTKSVNLLDWLPVDSQKPVLAHELTHALQDQQVGLTKWELAGAKDDAPLPDQQEYVVEESQSARQCVTEGQAQVVWFDYTLAPANKTILTAPEYVDAVRAAMGDSKDSPVFAQAPLFLRESLLMPYTFGLDFVKTVLANKGKDAAFEGLLKDPPIDTRQIMQPETYLLHQQVAALTVPDLNAMVAPNYTRFDFGGMGEFDVFLLAKQYGVDDPPNYYRHWRGGYYFAAQQKNGPKDQIAMLYFSRWDSPEAARDFATLYATATPKRYDNPVKWSSACAANLIDPTLSPTPGGKDGAAVSKKGARGSSNSKSGDEEGASGAGCNPITGSVKEGLIHIEQHDNDLLIMEGYDDAVIAKARDVLLYGMSLPAAAKEKNAK